MAQPTLHRKVGSYRRRKYLAGYLFIAPICLGILLFTIAPMVYSLFISFTKFDGANAPEFIGLANYRRLLFEDPIFWKTVVNTLYASVSILLVLVFSLLLALAMNADIRGLRVYRTIFYIPSICSTIAISLVWKWMLDSNFGLINQMLKLIGINGPAWLTEEVWAMPAMILNGVWGGLGFNMLLYLAALKNIPRAYYEAAMIDGANAWQRFRRITLPGVSPITFYILVTSFISAMQDFSRFMVLTNGGPGEHTTTTVVFYIWQRAFRYLGTMGYASAMSWVLGAIVCVVTVINFKTSNRWVNYD